VSEISKLWNSLSPLQKHEYDEEAKSQYQEALKEYKKKVEKLNMEE